MSAGWRRAVEQPADGGQEAHVGHAVGLVDDDLVDVGQVHVAAVHEILEAPRAGDEDVHSAAQAFS